MNEPVIDLRDLMCRRGGSSSFTLLLDHLELYAGEVLTVTGRSGTGKSTLLEVLGLALAPSEVGQFRFQTCSLSDLWRVRDDNALAALRSRHIGFLLQQGGLLPYLSVYDNILLPLQLNGMAQNTQEVETLAERLGITPLLTRKPGSLSAGERQRAALARALIHRPALLLADEPTSALDPFYARQVFDLLLEIGHERQAAVVIVSHDADWVKSVGLKELSPKTSRNGDCVISRFGFHG